MTKIQECQLKVARMVKDELEAYRVIVSMSNCKRTDKELIYDAIDLRLNRPSPLAEIGDGVGEVD